MLIQTIALVHLNAYTDSLKFPIEHYTYENKKKFKKTTIISEMIKIFRLKKT